MKILAYGTLSGLLVIGLWLAMIWATSADLVAEGPDTDTARLLAAPLETWIQFVGPRVENAANVIGLTSKSMRNVAVLLAVLGPLVVLSAIPFCWWFSARARSRGLRS